MKEKIESSRRQPGTSPTGLRRRSATVPTQSVAPVGRIGDIGQLGSEAAQGVTDDLNELLPAIKRAGYKVQGIDLDLAIPPKIAVHCHLEAQVSGSDREALLAASRTVDHRPRSRRSSRSPTCRRTCWSARSSPRTSSSNWA